MPSTPLFVAVTEAYLYAIETIAHGASTRNREATAPLKSGPGGASLLLKIGATRRGCQESNLHEGS